MLFMIFFFLWIGGLSGFGKISFVYKMVNIVGCEVIFMESYINVEEVKDFNYDEFSMLDLFLLFKVILKYWVNIDGLWIVFFLVNSFKFLIVFYFIKIDVIIILYMLVEL